MLVAAIGLYGVIAYNVMQRMHELGIRIALGAQSGNVVRLVVTEAASFAGAGAVIGVVAALLAARWIQPLLFGESARDPLVFAVVAGIIGLVSVAASAGPALRSS